MRSVYLDLLRVSGGLPVLTTTLKVSTSSSPRQHPPNRMVSYARNVLFQLPQSYPAAWRRVPPIPQVSIMLTGWCRIRACVLLGFDGKYLVPLKTAAC